jgi:ERCC4-type nuclease
MKIIIDEREAMLYELCVSMNQTLNMPIEKRVLELGDILFLSDDESITHLIIERKSFADYCQALRTDVTQSSRIGLETVFRIRTMWSIC